MNEYSAWLRRNGKRIPYAELFSRWIAPTDSVLEYGCGDGSFLAALWCEKRCGIEPNADARAEAGTRLDAVYQSVTEAPSGHFTVAICRHDIPDGELAFLRTRLRDNGKLMLICPALHDKLSFVCPVEFRSLSRIGLQIELIKPLYRWFRPKHFLIISRTASALNG